MLPERIIMPTCKTDCHWKGLALFCNTGHLDFMVSTGLQCNFNIILNKLESRVTTLLSYYEVKICIIK